MQKSDRERFLKIVIGFAELKGKALSKPALELYWNSMQGWSIEDFEQAANHLIRSCEFMPTPKDFEDLRKAGRPTSAEAWMTARRHLRWGLHGYTLDPKCPPPIAQVVAAIGGANTIAMCDEHQLHFLERRFAQRYEELGEVTEKREAVPRIAALARDVLRLR